MKIIDGFLSVRTYADLREYADISKFSDIKNEFDGVVYPKICVEIPDHVREEILAKLETWKGSKITGETMFMRQSPLGVECPHKVHSDLSMGRYSLMLYLNRLEHCAGGTSFVSHIDTGIAYHPVWPGFVDIITAHQNLDESWQVREIAHMIPNRAVIFDAGALHRAEPIGGFGSTPQDTRLVLTCFFS